MSIGHDIAYFFGGLFLSNAVPHLVSGMMGKPFQSPFATPHGEGFSSSRVNALWGWFNVAVGYVLLFQVGAFDLHDVEHVLAAAIPAILSSLMLAGHFGKFNGGNDPVEEQKRRILSRGSSDSPA